MTDCEQIDETYEIGEYEIIKYSCLGPVGPPYHPLDLYKNGEKIANNGFKKDSCVIKFNPEIGLYLYLNICDKSISEIKAKKTLLELKNIDSINIFSKKNNLTKKLTKTQVKKIVNDWNKSKVSDYRDKPFDSIYYPDYSYKLFVFHNGISSEFIAGNYLMADRNKWTYIMSKKKDIEYFDKIWND